MSVSVGRIKLVLFDVDGVLTDGTLYIGTDGESFKGFHVRDGVAVALLRAHGIRTGVLSGRTSRPLERRVQELGVDVTVMGLSRKLEGLAQVSEQLGVTPAEIAYVGDDVIDLPLVGSVARFYAPADAHPLVRDRADVVLSARGGEGAAREAAEHLLSSDGASLDDIYAPLLANWSDESAIQ
jgi:3-deoxy-D-manno-octulosonate 8-phosphate phosphatase (KDO 8-P phosphatase)